MGYRRSPAIPRPYWSKSGRRCTAGRISVDVFKKAMYRIYARPRNKRAPRNFHVQQAVPSDVDRRSLEHTEDRAQIILMTSESATIPTIRGSCEVVHWSRLLASAAILAMAMLGLAHNPTWHLGTLVLGLSMVAASQTNRFLPHMGERERENLYLPGGVSRSEALEVRDPAERVRFDAANRGMP